MDNYALTEVILEARRKKKTKPFTRFARMNNNQLGQLKNRPGEIGILARREILNRIRKGTWHGSKVLATDRVKVKPQKAKTPQQQPDNVFLHPGPSRNVGFGKASKVKTAPITKPSIETQVRRHLQKPRKALEPEIVATVRPKFIHGPRTNDYPDGMYPSHSHYVSVDGRVISWNRYKSQGGFTDDDANLPGEQPDEKHPTHPDYAKHPAKKKRGKWGKAMDAFNQNMDDRLHRRKELERMPGSSFNLPGYDRLFRQGKFKNRHKGGWKG